MSLTSLLTRMFGRQRQPQSTRRRSTRPALEQLESRLTPYAATGNAWPHPEVVTISFMPDGVDLGAVNSDLFAVFNGDFGSTSVWQNAILKGAQTWAQYTNLNFSVVSDNGSPMGAGDYQQGDPGMGDIRVTGANLGLSSLAWAMQPPPVNNYSIAGDFILNTFYVFNVNGLPFDLSTVSMHEFGHTLGLSHSTLPSAVMYPVYNGVDAGLSSDDIAGIRSIYGGVRAQDAYDAAASNGSFATATNVTSALDPTTRAGLVTGLDITATNDLDFFKVTAPAGGTGQLTVTVQSTGLSLLAPNLRLYNSAQQLVANISGTGSFGSTLSRTINVTAGQDYYIRVASANSSPFGIGAYAVTMNFGSGATPSVPLPDTQTENGSPLSSGGGEALNGELSLRDIRRLGHEHVDVMHVAPLGQLQQRGRDNGPGRAEFSGQGRAALGSGQVDSVTAAFILLARRGDNADAVWGSQDAAAFWDWIAQGGRLD